MKRQTSRVGAVLVVALGVATIGYYRHVQHLGALRIEVRGGDGGGLPLAQPEAEHFDAVALGRVTEDAAAAGLQAFIVLRHGHVVFQRFGHGVSADTPIDSGGFAPVLVALLAGVVAREDALALTTLGRFDPSAWRDTIEHASGQRYPELLSRQVWARLNAASAWIVLPAPGAAVPVECCFRARLQDWLRIGALLVDGGSFEGSRVVTANWVTAMRQPASADGRAGLGLELAAAAHGAAPFAADDLVFLRGPGRWRLWAVPSLHLVVLFGSTAGRDAGGASGSPAASAPAASAPAAESWDETRLPNLVIEAVTDRTAPQNPASLLQQLVPHH